MHLSDQHTDSELVLQLQADSEAAFDEIYRRYWKKIYNEAFRRLRDQALCEEIVQDVFVDLWSKRRQREIGDLFPYLCSSARYQVFAVYRKKKRLPCFEAPLEELAVSSYAADTACFEEELVAFIDSWLQSQPEGRRKIFHMRYLDGMETREIADELRISRKTVQNQLHLARNQFRLSVLKHLAILLFLSGN